MRAPGICTRPAPSAVRAYNDGFEKGVECGERAAASLFRAWWLGVGFAAGLVVASLPRFF